MPAFFIQTAVGAASLAAQAAAAALSAVGVTGTGAGLLKAGSLGFSIASAEASAKAAKAAGKNASAVAQANSESAQGKADLLAAAGREKQKILLEQRRALLARNRAKFGKASVVFEGSPLIVQQDAAKNLTNDAAMARYNTTIGVQSAQFEGQIFAAKGRIAESAGKLQAGAALFSGGVQATQTLQQTQRAENA